MAEKKNYFRFDCELRGGVWCTATLFNSITFSSVGWSAKRFFGGTSISPTVASELQSFRQLSADASPSHHGTLVCATLSTTKSATWRQLMMSSSFSVSFARPYRRSILNTFSRVKDPPNILFRATHRVPRARRLCVCVSYYFHRAMHLADSTNHGSRAYQQFQFYVARKYLRSPFISKTQFLWVWIWMGGTWAPQPTERARGRGRPDDDGAEGNAGFKREFPFNRIAMAPAMYSVIYRTPNARFIRPSTTFYARFMAGTGYVCVACVHAIRSHINALPRTNTRKCS